MILNRLELTNFRKHRHLDIKLNTGVTGIIGDNGAGKSSIVEAIQFALTGTLYTGTKSEAITVGQEFGSVRLTFTLNEKQGTLIRYLSPGNPQLDYGEGGTKKKAGDVKELWEALLQIGPEIISRVIIARQGDIPLLFSGDSTVREKIFQKIFLVPNTEKVRALINKNYLLQVPPMLYTEDLDELTTQEATTKEQIEKLKKEISTLACLSEDAVDAARSRIKFINKCQTDLGASAIINEGIARSEKSVKDYKETQDDIKNTLSSIKIEDYELQRATQLQQKALYTQKLTLEAELNELENIAVPVEEYTRAKDNVEALTKSYADINEAFVKQKITKASLEERLHKYNDLSGQSVCDTCGQSLHSVTDLIELLTTELNEATAAYEASRTTYELTRQELSEARKYLEEIDEVENERKRVLKNLEQFKTLTFDEASLLMFTEVINQYREYQKDLNEITIKLAAENNKLNTLRRELNELSTYDGDGDPEKEKTTLAEQLQAHDDVVRKLQILQVDLKVKELELTQLAQRKVVSKQNAKKNKKRSRYTELLGIALDTLSTRQFPRKLILNYADVVSEYLQEKLQGFNIPYTAKVTDGFKIEMYDEDGNKLPAVSGGQEMQIGISLHLALHELFSQSFPLLIIDEGTTHLDSKNRKAYFDIVSKLKTQSKVKQIIIIDHDPQLATVVDNTIELE